MPFVAFSVPQLNPLEMLLAPEARHLAVRSEPNTIVIDDTL